MDIKKSQLNFKGISLIALLCVLLAGLTSCGRVSESKKETADSQRRAGARNNLSSQAKVEDSSCESVEESSDSSQKPLSERLKAVFGDDTDYNDYSDYYDDYNDDSNIKEQEKDYEELKSYYTLTIDDNFVVTRSGDEPVSNLGWEITRNGVTVLSRVAENETTYRYFSNAWGEYTVTLTAFVDGEYRPVSNTVSYVIGEDTVISTDSNPEITQVKSALKNTLKTYTFSSNEVYTYVIGYVGDFLHDGGVTGVAFFKNTASNDDDSVYVVITDSDNMSKGSFGNWDMSGDEFCVWNDVNTGEVYAVCIHTEGETVTVADLTDNEILWEYSNGDYNLFGKAVTKEEFESYGFYDNIYFPETKETDTDHVYVFRNGEASFESIY